MYVYAAYNYNDNQKPYLAKASSYMDVPEYNFQLKHFGLCADSSYLVNFS